MNPTSRGGSRGARATTTTDRLVRIAAALLVAAMLAGLVIGALGPDGWREAIAHGGPGCPWKAATTIDCPFCGMTRATLAMGGGHFGAALALHPLAPLVLLLHLGLLGLVAAGKGDLILRGRRPVLLLIGIVVIWVVRLVV